MSSVVEQTAGRIEEYLQELGAFTKQGDGSFFAKRGSTVVAIRIEPWEDDDTMVHVEANVVQGAALNAPVLRQLLEFNHDAAYGAFGVAENGMITVHHCLLGSTLHKQEFLPAVLEVAKVADDWDDVIVEQAGGKRAVDMLEDALKPPPKPTIELPGERKE